MKTHTKKIAVMIVVMAIIIGAEVKAQGLKGDKDKKKEKNKTEKANDEKCFDENTQIINLGLGFGGGDYYRGYSSGYSARRSPAFSLSYEQSLPKRIGPGYVGVGAYAGFQTARYHYNYYHNNGNYYYYEHKYNYTMIAARGAYHWDVLNSKKAEVYVGALVGIRIQTYSYETNDTDPDYNYRLNEGSAYVAYSLFAGARWYFVDHVALFGEAGYGISYLTGGVSFKF